MRPPSPPQPEYYVVAMRVEIGKCWLLTAAAAATIQKRMRHADVC
jgi:hypothetical protein